MNIRRASKGSVQNWSPSTGLGGRLRLDSPVAFAGMRSKNGTFLFNAWGGMSANPFSEIAYEVGAQFFPGDPPSFCRVAFSYSDPEAVKADLEAAGYLDIRHDQVDLHKVVYDWSLLARGIVFGNPLIEEIKNRQGVEPGEVMDAVTTALRERFGHAPAKMPLQATVYAGRAS